MKLLLVAAIVCSAIILTECNNDVENSDLYEPASKSCLVMKAQNAKDIKRCLQQNLIFPNRVCEYSCSKQGSLLTTICVKAYPYKDLPNCADLTCVAKKGDGSGGEKPAESTEKTPNPAKIDAPESKGKPEKSPPNKPLEEVAA